MVSRELHRGLSHEVLHFLGASPEHTISMPLAIELVKLTRCRLVTVRHEPGLRQEAASIEPLIQPRPVLATACWVTAYAHVDSVAQLVICVLAWLIRSRLSRRFDDMYVAVGPCVESVEAVN